jgi:hypothetical protein
MAGPGAIVIFRKTFRRECSLSQVQPILMATVDLGMLPGG